MGHTFESIKEIHNLPITTLLLRAQETLHRFHDPARVELHTLCSVKTGGCSENCAYCSQSAHHKTFLKEGTWLSHEDIIQKAKEAKAAGAMRFSLSYAWRTIPSEAHLSTITEVIREVKALGIQVCCTLGMLTPAQAEQLKEAGCDCYNHNIDTSRAHYGKIITTRTFDDRLDTLKNVQNAGIMVCCGGIVGMGESIDDRINMIVELA
ncbi:MAG: biotin synthase BioB, partial [Verrucomicrobia bacterium GWC2_42_7]